MTDHPCNGLLACPRCDTPLTRLRQDTQLERWRCRACDLDFPELNGIACLFAEPAYALSEWRNRWHLELAQLDSRLEELGACPAPSSGATRERVRILTEGYRAKRRQLNDLLTPLTQGEPVAEETYLALKTRLPSQVTLTGYYTNVHRDWCWGDVENQASLAAVVGALATSAAPVQRVLVLGAGAGRLAAELHARLKPELTCTLDFNPFLALIAQAMNGGEQLTLEEQPIAATHITNMSVTQTLHNPHGPQNQTQNGLHILLGDVCRAPFAAGSFDLVVTPWLLDVLDTPMEDFLPHVNRLLKIDGRWITHGSMAFPANAACGSLAELIEIANNTGFVTTQPQETRMPYMQSPLSRHGRVESVVTLAANKHSHVAPKKRHQHLPDWLVTLKDPIPLLPAFQAQANTTRIHGFLMGLIDGKRSAKDMAQILEAQRLMPAKEAEAALRGFLLTMYEEAKAG